MLSKAYILTYRIPLILVEDLAVTPVHVGHVNGVAICPIDFSVWERCEVNSVLSSQAEYRLYIGLKHSQ